MTVIASVDRLAQDVRYGIRALRAAPVVSMAAILSLALGIGAATAVFSVVDGVLLEPFPVKDQGRLLVVWTSKPERGFDHWPFSYASYEGMRERLRTTSGVGAHPYAGTLTAVLYLDDGSAMPLERTAVTGEWFDVLGVRARAGRLLTAADDQVGAPRVVVLSSGVAERLFGSAPDGVGRTVRIQENTFTVVGVTPADFDYPRTAEAWVPAVWFRHIPEVAWDLVARVAPGFTIQQARADLASALATLPPESGPLGGTTDQVINARPFADAVVGDVRPALLMLGGAVMLMLVVAGVNVANLLLVRGLARRRELSVRAAIGASRRRILRQLATEAMVLAGIGAVLAIVVAHLSLGALLALAPAELPRLASIGIDARALGFAAGAAMAAAVLFGMLPALQTASIEPAEALRAPDGSAVRGTRRYWLRHGLVVAQIAIATLVLSTAGLLLRSFDRMQRLDPGFAAQDVVLASVAIPPSRYAEPADLQRAMVRLAGHAGTLPGISQASAVTTPPFAGTQGVDATVFAEGQAFDESTNPIVNYEGADSAYFATLGLPILRGRAIDDRDREGSAPVVVVNETFARLFWPGRDPLGRRIKWGSSKSESEWRTVVGLAADARYRDLTSVRPGVYVPYGQGIPVSPGYLAVRTSSPATAAGSIRRAVADYEPGAAVVSVTPLPRLLAAPLARPRFQSALVACFAALALGLAVVGTYGTLSFFVRQRRREIGIRMALGAAPSDVRRLVLRHGITIGTLGVLLGSAAALAAGRLVQPLLFAVAPTDPLVLIAAAAALLAATAAATVLPTRLATRTDPLLVLRDE
jgi:putative ABC transport system permease protein